ncbi:MFS transporter [Nonomuraea sp. NPDC050404]|uniref:MFS transporter n=1 Tax=Nonomuraea sp. NPDC050404 TaxID=3155783 RepID=UPI00340490F9
MPMKVRGAPQAVVAILAFAGIVVALMQTMMIPLIPQLPRLLHATPSDATWAITATLLTGAVATPVVGRLGDMYGKRRMLLIGLALLVLGSFIGALSGTLAPMVVGRSLQGLAMGVIPLGISVMRDVLPADRLGSATALMSASLGVGGALGLPAAALVAERADWHLLFWTAAGFGVLAMALVLAVVPESQVRGGGRFDVVGAAGLSAGLSCLLLAVSKGVDWGGQVTAGLLGTSAILLGLWGWWELRTGEPLVDLRTSARRQVLLTNLASAVFGFGMFAMTMVLPQLLQLPRSTGYGLGTTMLGVGLTLAPSGLVMMAMSPVSARISRARGPKVTLMAGALVVAAGYGLGVLMMSALWQLVFVSSVIGAGIGLAYGAMPALIMSAVPIGETAAANSLNTLMRAIGTSISSAVAGVILANLTNAAGLPTLDGFRLVMAIGGGASLVAIAIAAFLPAHRVPAGTLPGREPSARRAVRISARPRPAERAGLPGEDE